MLSRLIILITLLTLLAGCSAITGYNKDENLDIAEESKADVFVKMGMSYMERGQYKVALEKLENGLEVDPSNSEAHHVIAVLYQHLKQDDIARYHFKKSIALRPSNAGAQNDYGRFLCLKGDYAEAERRFKIAYETPLYPRPWLALTNAGTCAVKAGNLEQGELYLRRALAKQPNYAPALQEMARIGYQQGDYMKARAFIARAEDNGGHTPVTLLIGFRSERAVGNEEVAEEYRVLLEEKFPDSEEAAIVRNQF